MYLLKIQVSFFFCEQRRGDITLSSCNGKGKVVRFAIFIVRIL